MSRTLLFYLSLLCVLFVFVLCYRVVCVPDLFMARSYFVSIAITFFFSFFLGGVGIPVSALFQSCLRYSFLLSSSLLFVPQSCLFVFQLCSGTSSACLYHLIILVLI